MKLHLPTISQFAALILLNITNAVTQLLLISMLIQHGENEKLGKYFIVVSFSVLASILVNFGTSQTAVIEIRKAKSNTELEHILSNTLALRFFPLLFSMLVVVTLSLFTLDGWLFLLVIPVIVAELINPQVHLIATYKVNGYAFLNLIMRLLLILMIYILRENKMIIEFALLFSGLVVLLLNLFYLPSIFIKNGALKIFPNRHKYFELVKTNWLVLGNSIAVHLQQSIFLFALPGYVTPLYLSAYGFIDKLISSFRMMINAYSAAIIPNATNKYLQGLAYWRKMKLQQNILLASFCLVAGLLMYFFPEKIVTILLFGKKENTLFINQTIELLRLISPVPLLIALNVLNVLELFLEKRYTAYFGTGLVILFIAIICLVGLKLGMPQFYAGFYPLLIEGASFFITFVIVNKVRNDKK